VIVGARVREVREYVCLSVAAAAEAAGLDPDVVAAIEAGTRQPEELELARLARAYGYPPAYFRNAESPGAPATGVPRLVADLTEHDRNELDRFTAFLRDTARY
jgi:transcriptional regulator with XRE-family HTH domain